MPQYVFYCPECKEEYNFKWSFTQHEKMKDAVKCLSCGGIKLNQKVLKNNVIFKGYGWTTTNSLTEGGIDPYAMSDKAIRQQDDDQKRADDMIADMTAKAND